MNPFEFRNQVTKITEYPRPSHFVYEFEIYVGSELKFKPVSVANCDYIENYAEKTGATLVVTLMMSMGDYYRHLYTNKDKEISVKVKKYFVTSNSQNKLELDPIIVTFRAFCYDSNDMDLSARPNIDKDQTLQPYKLELIEANVYDVQSRLVGAPIRNRSKMEIIKYFFAKAAQSLPETIRSTGVTMIPPNVTGKRNQLIIPHKTRLINLPRFLQEEEGGVYNYGIANYFSNVKRRWFVFPPYNTSQHNDSNYLLEVFLTPPNVTGPLDRTWSYNEGKKRTLSIITTSNFKAENNKAFNFINSGNGIKFLKADETFNDYVEVAGNVATLTDKHMASFSLEQRENDLQITKYSENLVTNNVANNISTLAQRAGMYISITWNHARPDLLVPGMPVNVNYIDDSGVGKKVGVLHKAIVNETRVQKGMQNNAMMADVVLIVFIDDPNTELRVD